jgi:hypothetical protein
MTLGISQDIFIIGIFGVVQIIPMHFMAHLLRSEGTMNLKISELENLLLTVYKASEISIADFARLLGKKECKDIAILTEGLVKHEPVRCYLINDADIINAHCKCIPREFGGAEDYFVYQAYPYIVFVLSVKNDALGDYFCLSAFDHDIFDQMRSLGEKN